MEPSKYKSILFLGTRDHQGSRFAEILFNFEAERLELLWKASSRGLAVGQGTNVDPIAESAVKHLAGRGLRSNDAFVRSPIEATKEDLERAHLIVALEKAEHWPMVSERFPAWAESVQYWEIEDAPQALIAIEREVMSLLLRLIVEGGNNR